MKLSPAKSFVSAWPGGRGDKMASGVFNQHKVAECGRWAISMTMATERHTVYRYKHSSAAAPRLRA